MSFHGRLRGGNDRRPITVQNRDWIVIGFYIARIVIGFLVLVKNRLRIQLATAPRCLTFHIALAN